MTSHGVLARLLRGESIPAEMEATAAGLLVPVLRVSFPVAKAREDLRIAYGWVSVCEIDGKPVVDSDNEIIRPDDLDAYARQFVLGRHGGKVMHSGEVEADLVESMMFTAEKQAVLGIDLGKVGWWAGLQYRKPETWERIKAGELCMFSLMGYAKPTPVDPEGKAAP